MSRKTIVPSSEVLSYFDNAVPDERKLDFHMYVTRFRLGTLYD